MNIIPISKKYFNDWLDLGLALWPHYRKKKDTLKKIFAKILKSSRETAFLYQREGACVAFINVSIRSDYVEGSHGSRVGYIEGIYVRPKYRKQGIAKKMIQTAEQWSKKHGCAELGSCALIRNIKSQRFHKKIGFEKVNTTVNFIKKIKGEI